MAVSKVHSAARDAAIAGADLSDQLYKFVAKNTAGELVLAGAQAQNIVGVVYETAPLGGAATFAMAGTGAFAKVVAGSALAVGASVSSDAQGRAIVATGNGVGTVRNAVTAAGQIVEVYLRSAPAA